ncbi:hypothetical protein [Streptomyces sp. NPDC053728]
MPAAGVARPTTRQVGNGSLRKRRILPVISRTRITAVVSAVIALELVT